MKHTEPAGGVRNAPISMTADEFREAGHALVEAIARFLDDMPSGPITPGDPPPVVRLALGDFPAPIEGSKSSKILAEAADLLFRHSLFNGHPRFLGFITSSAAPIGALGELLAASVNPNLGGWLLSPIASEIETQSIQWIAEIVGYSRDCGGLLVSGGNMANFVGFWAARRAKCGGGIRTAGVASAPPMRAYASSATHTWLEKVADLSGLGTDSIRLVPTDGSEQIDVEALRSLIEEDLKDGLQPFLVVGSAGTVSTGAVDPLGDLADVCREYDLWFHVDGAYGAPAAVLADAPPELSHMRRADSIAVDPHKWLYAPLEAGAILVRNNAILRDTFSYHPPYYPDKESAPDAGLMYYELGPQNSRGFRALKVWLALKQVGLDGYRTMIGDDIRLAKMLYDEVQANERLEAVTHRLSITTFRYVPEGVDSSDPTNTDLLNDVNRRLLKELQKGGEVFLSNAILDGRYLLRACVVNFRTTERDIKAVPEIVVRVAQGLPVD